MTTHTNTFAIAFLGFILSASFGQIPVLAADLEKNTATTFPPGGPPSPDPSGIAYWSSRGNLLISDGEVEEIPSPNPGAYQGANLFETTLRGILVRTSSTTGPNPDDANDTTPPLDPTNYSDEPVGVAFNPENGFCFISDDDKNEVFVINPGADLDCFTLGDNTVTSFDTSTSPAFASLPAGDPEGLGFDPGPTPSLTDNSLYISDGTNSEVYRLRPGPDGVFTGGGDDTMTHFDTRGLGTTFPDGIELHPDFGNLFIVDARPQRSQDPPPNPPEQLAEVTPDGALVRLLDISAANPNSVAGVSVAPASGTDTLNPCDNVYIVDRRADGDTQNDGRLYEFDVDSCTPTGNQPPSVSAGLDQTVNLPNSATLNGTVSDDGAIVSTTWSKVSGPGTVTFANPNVEDTTASFDMPGTYVLRLTAVDDGMLSASDDVTVTVNPTVSFSGVLYATTTGNGSASGAPCSGGGTSLTFADEDIVAFSSGTWSMYFDGSDVGLGGADIDAFHRMGDGSLLLSLRDPATITIGGAPTPVDDSDIVKFTPTTPTSIGCNTAGTFAWYFDGSDVGLETNGEDVDAIAFTTDGKLVVSTGDSAAVPGVSGADEDLLAFTATSPPGEVTSGTWALYFDGSDVALSQTDSENVDGTDIPDMGANTGHIHLTTVGAFSVTGVSGDGADIFTCVPGSTGSTTSCTNYTLTFDGSTAGLDTSSEGIDGFDIQ